MPDLPEVFLPYQQRAWAAIDAHQVVVIEKSRRTGFSWALGAVADAYAASQKADGGQDVLYMGYEREMTREFIDYVAMWAKAFQYAASEVQEFVFVDPDRPEKEIGAFRIKFASGFEVIALPSVPRALRGKQGLVILDEAAFMDNLEEVLKAAFALLIWGGKVVVCSTHNGDTNPFNQLVEDIRAGRLPYHLMRLTFDEALAEGLYRRVCLTTGKEWSPEAEAAWRQSILDIYRDNADEELHVIPNPSTGAYLPGPLLEARTVPDTPVLRWTAPVGFAQWPEHLRVAEALAWCEANLKPVLATLDADTPHVFGEDFGLVRDLTVIWPLAIGRNLVRRTPFVVELRTVPHEQQRQVLFYLVDRLPRFRGGKMDAGGNGSYLAQVAAQRYGLGVEQVMLSEPWYRDNMPPFKAGIEDGMLLLPDDREIHGDLRSLKLVRGVARVPHRTRTDEGASRHGDAAIAACLAYAASRADPEVYEYEGGAARSDNQVTSSGWSERARDWEEDNMPPGRRILPDLRRGGFA